MRTRLFWAAAIALCAVNVGHAAGQRGGPVETKVREFLRALVMHDAQAFAKAIVPDSRSGRLLNPQPLTPEAREEGERRLESLQIKLEDAFLLRGEPVKADGKGDYPVGTMGHVMAASNGGPSIVTVVRRPEGWRVDLRWWLAMVELSNASGPPEKGSPEYVVKSLTLAMIALNRDEAMKYAVPGADVNLLFDGAPPYREPSGVLEGAAMEMPLVEVGPGEFYRMPSGRVVEGVKAADRKVLVGQFGPTEMPFALTRVNGEWRVEAEPYFAVINR
jgi:hypothetical protein